MGYVLVIGAKSDIAKAISKIYAKNGYDLYLAARNVYELESFAMDIKVKMNRKVELVELDILGFKTHQKFYENLQEKPVGVISAIGYLGNQENAQTDFKESEIIINTNFTGLVSLFNIIANDFEANREGFIIGISSVSGDRGRKSNFIYGASKAALSSYLSGLRNRLYPFGINVMTVIPGYVETKMTENLDLPKKLTSQPKDVAKDIYHAHQKGKNVIYTSWIWRWIMVVIKIIPESKFKKMSL
jgi:decaprenylphospho-beta-D-erythro-pentofuranosid-2-ulose 2-reductase